MIRMLAEEISYAAAVRLFNVITFSVSLAQTFFPILTMA